MTKQGTQEGGGATGIDQNWHQIRLNKRTQAGDGTTGIDKIGTSVGKPTQGGADGGGGTTGFDKIGIKSIPKERPMDCAEPLFRQH